MFFLLCCHFVPRLNTSLAEMKSRKQQTIEEIIVIYCCEFSGAFIIYIC